MTFPPNSLFLKMFYYLSNIVVMYPLATQSSFIIVAFPYRKSYILDNKQEFSGIELAES